MLASERWAPRGLLDAKPVLTVGLGERGGAGAGHEVGAGQEGAEAGAGRGGTGEVRAGWLDRSGSGRG